MPLKPRPTRVTRQKRVVHNERATAAGRALQYPNPTLARKAIEFEDKDVEDGTGMRGRYVRVRDRLMHEMGCSRTSAERAIRDGKLMRQERFLAELPRKAAELSIQLHRIADLHEDKEPSAAVAAIREISRINGLYAPKEVKITQVDRETFDLRAVMDCLSERGRAALDIVLDELEAAKSSGRLALPEPDEIEAEAVAGDEVDGDEVDGDEVDGDEVDGEVIEGEFEDADGDPVAPVPPTTEMPGS